MFKEAVIYYPTDSQALAQVYKELADFCSAAVVRYVRSLKLNNNQIEALYESLKEDMLTPPVG
ncbi:MAG: hypothetical protein FWB74_00950 [Defluviitaleaceae bacterium]|nr:hypothetical protein [Defluviitaleaceae bacterium]